jgi:hypothetical protein
MMDSKTRKTEQQILPRSCRPFTAVSPEMLQHADTIVGKEGRITYRQQALCHLIRKGGVCHIICDIGYWNVCSNWVSRVLTVEQETG